MLLNEYILLQILVIITIFFLFWTSDIFTTIMIGIVYLLIISLISLYLDSDLLISFLIVIDLGVFFIMFAFILHLTKFLVTKFNYNYSFKNIYIINSLILFIIIFNMAINTNTNINYNNIIEYTWFFFISYYNYYSLNLVIFNSDMQLLKEAYFHIANLEFFIISIFVYVGLISSLMIFSLTKKMILKKNLKLIKSLKNYNKNNSSYYFKHQDMINQITLPSSSRVWVKK